MTGLVAHEYGDSGVLFDVVADGYEERWWTAQSVGEALRAKPPVGFQDVVASYQNVFVAFDPRRTDHAAITAAVEEVAAHAPARPEPTIFEIGVVYSGEHGPDVASLAAECGLSVDEVIAAHSAAPWTVRFIASPIGAPFLDGSQLPISVPRLATPRPRVEPGSVALSGRQCVVYNAPSPGGWQIVGRTPCVMFDLDTPPHVAYKPGDRFAFRPIAASEWDRWRRPPRAVTS